MVAARQRQMTKPAYSPVRWRAVERLGLLILAVQSLCQKYSRSRLTQIKSITPPSHPTEGRIAIVTDAGRDAVDAAALGARRDRRVGSFIWTCERSNGVLTNGDCSGRQSRVVLAPVAGVKFAEASRPDRALTKP
jgi:hypothetical protein